MYLRRAYHMIPYCFFLFFILYPFIFPLLAVEEELLPNDVIHDSTLICPSEAFKLSANVNSEDLLEEARRDREGFWASQAENLAWFKKWEKVLDWSPPYAKWFVGAKLNACYNCLDRHMETLTRNKIALKWEGEDGEQRVLTYADLYEEVNRLSNGLKRLGVQKGDRVAIYLPMVPEAIVSMLSCARIGAVHTVIFGGFSADALKDRILDAEAKVVITADGGLRRGKVVPLKEAADEAVRECPSVKSLVVVRRTHQPVNMEEGRDFWYGDLIQEAERECPPEEMDAEDLLFILYTSGTTGKPKGVIHTTGGYLLGATMSMQWVFDLKPSDVYWCTADIGWITGHSYVTYGPLSNGATQLIYEGAPDWPQKNRFWELIEKHKVSILYTAPTLVRAFMKWGEEWMKNSDLSSLRLLGSVGEPINPQAWIWYHTHVGKGRCPVVDTWWQTETGSIMIAPLPGLTHLKPGSATTPLPGVDVEILCEKGVASSSGLLAITSPWPSMLRGIYNDPERYEEVYWRKWGGQYYFTGDEAKKDADGYFWLMGRVDDVMSISGHRIGTMEVESAFVSHPSVAEAAVIGVDHSIKGQAIAAFISLKEGVPPSQELAEELKEHIVRKIGAIARPEKVIFIYDLPKTRSGKIMRRLLRDVAEGRVLGDATTLSDPAVIDEVKRLYDDES